VTFGGITCSKCEIRLTDSQLNFSTHGMVVSYPYFHSLRKGGQFTSSLALFPRLERWWAVVGVLCSLTGSFAQGNKGSVSNPRSQVRKTIQSVDWAKVFSVYFIYRRNYERFFCSSWSIHVFTELPFPWP